MKAENFAKILNADFYTGVPDSQLKALCNYLMHTYGIDPKHHVIAANEGNCTALAAGYHLATGKVPVVYMQNSGEGNIINPVASLLNDKVYAIPMIFVIGWRGEPGIHDEPQHIYQGEVTLKLLEDMGIRYFVIGKDTTEEEVSAAMQEFRKELDRGEDVAFVIRKGALSYEEKVEYRNDNPMIREEIIRHIMNICKRDPRAGKVTTGGIVTVKDSVDHWYLSWTINRQPQFRAQPEGQVCVWLYGLFTDVPGDYVKKPMRDCTGKEICEEWLYHLGVPEEQIEELAEHSANTVPCMMPYITAFFMPRADGDRPLVVPEGAVNFAFIGQFAETPRDTIFTTEYSMRTGMEAVYTLLDIDRGVPEVWGSVFDLRVLLNATVLLRDGKPATDMNMNVLEKLLLSRGLKEIEHTDIYGLLKEFGVIPTTDENRDVPVPATGAVWPGIH